MSNLSTKFLEVGLSQRAWGKTLVWLGVFAWLPFFYLVSLGREVSIFPFLAVHLTGVLGGSWLLSDANKKAGIVRTKHGGKRRLVGRIMIYLGVLAWVPYIYLTRSLGQDIEIRPFLIAHLTGVLGGAAVRASIELERVFKKGDASQ